MQRIPAEVLVHPIEGINLTGSTLGEQLPQQGTAVLLFLRHLG